MRINLGSTEQIVRAIVGAGLIIMTGLGAITGLWKVLAVVLGCVGVFTASSGFCPLYRVLGISVPDLPRRIA
jgi:hypothetical protein